MTNTETANDKSRWIALHVLCAGVLMIVLDMTVVNVALPSIQDDLGFSQSSLAWVINAYLIAFGGLLLLSGRLGDLVGHKSIFMIGLVIFTAASVWCGLAQTQEMLVAARFVQGLGGAMTSAVVLALIVTMFPEPREMAKALGEYAFVASAGGSVGLLVGGVLTDSINWHWIFFINVPIGLATGLLAARLVHRDEGIGIAKGADVLGALLVTSSLMLGVYTIVKPAAERGWADGQTLLLGGLALALLGAFILREATARTPLMPLRMFRSRNVSGANVIQVLLVAGLFGMFFMGSLYLQRVLGYGPLEIGFAFLPATLIMGTMSIRFSEPLITRFGARTVLIPGLVLLGVGLALFTRAPVDGMYVRDVLPQMLITGFGVGLCFPALMGLAMSGATPEDAGLASGVVNTTAQVGASLGLAVLATLSGTRTEHLLEDGESAAAALTGGYHLAFVIAAGLLVAALAVAIGVLKPSPAPDPAHAHASQQPATEEG